MSGISCQLRVCSRLPTLWTSGLRNFTSSSLKTASGLNVELNAISPRSLLMGKKAPHALTIGGVLVGKRCITTTKKPQINVSNTRKTEPGEYNTETIGDHGDIIIIPEIERRPPPVKDVEQLKDPRNEKNWMSYGYCYTDYWEDRIGTHMNGFIYMTMVVASIGFAWMYMPDVHQWDWATREAYLEIGRREKLGLPYIDMDLIPRERIVLPTEEELGDYPVLI